MDSDWKDYYQSAVVSRCSGDATTESLNAIRHSMQSGNLALLIGAGVTAGLVGNWKELLNELAIMRCGSLLCRCGAKKPGDPRLNQLRDYIKKVKDGSFLPVDTGVLEQGEYLMYDPGDMEARRLNRQTASTERWRERYFAAQVGDAIRSLTHKHLCDAKGQTPKTLEDDFIDWCLDNTDDDFFGVHRREVSREGAVAKALKAKGITAEALAVKLHDRYGMVTDLAGLKREAARTKTDASEIEAVVFERLAAQAADALWRPNYGTLYQMLKLCAVGGIQQVITYNFDTIFDRLLINPGIQRLLEAKTIRPVQVYSFHNERPIELKGADTDREKTNAIRIYHVHGILDGEENKEDRLPVMPIIFSENSYQTYQNRVMNWSNIRIAEAMNTYDLLCVGFSGTDANFRNLVQLCRQLQDTPIFASEKNQHKVYLTRACKDDVDRYIQAKDTFTSGDLECAYWCVDTYFDLVQMYYDYQLGLTVLWSEDYDDMADKLGQLLKK